MLVNNTISFYKFQGIKITLPNDINKIYKQIQMLRYQLQHDTREKDIRIHKTLLNILKRKEWAIMIEYGTNIGK